MNNDSQKEALLAQLRNLSQSKKETLRDYKNRISVVSGAGGFPYDCVNEIVSRYQPASLKLIDNGAFHYFFKYCLQEIYSIFIIDNLPDGWNKEYMIYNLLCRGWIACVNAATYGWIPQPCVWGAGRNVFAMPTSVLVVNGWFHPENGKTEYTIGEDAIIIKVSPDYSPIVDIACYYAERMACLFSSMDNSAILVRNGYITISDNKAANDTITEALSGILNGELIVGIQGKTNPANPNNLAGVNILESDIRKHYIVGDILADFLTLVDMFHADIGFPVINRAKKERVLESEQDAQNETVTIKSDLWYETLKKSFDDFNRKSGYHITVKKRYGGGSNGDVPENTSDSNL